LRVPFMVVLPEPVLAELITGVFCRLLGPDTESGCILRVCQRG
jgi:hypothetical protein